MAIEDKKMYILYLPIRIIKSVHACDKMLMFIILFIGFTLFANFFLFLVVIKVNIMVLCFTP